VPYYYADAIISLVLVAAIAFFDPRFAAALRRIVRPGRTGGARA